MHHTLHTGAGLGMLDGIARWYEESLLREILDYINTAWFTIDLHAYHYIPVNERTAGNLRTLILGLAFGIILAAASAAYTRQSAGKLCRRLVKTGALAKESAVTLLDVDLFRSSALRRELRRGAVLRKYVKCVEEEEYVSAGREGETRPPFKMDFSRMHFYLPEELRYTAEVRYETRGSGWGTFVLSALLTVALAALTCFFLPDLLGFADWLIGMTAP